MAGIVDPSQDFCSPYQQHMICSLGKQQERQIFYNLSKANIDTSRRSYRRRYTFKVCSHCGRTGHLIDTCYRKHGFLPQFKFKSQKAYCNSNQQNHEGSRSEVHSQQIGFTHKQYQTWLTLLQQSKSNDNASNQISVIPSDTTTLGNKFFSSFSSWILDSGTTDHICPSLTHFTSYHQINPISVKLPNGNQVIANYSGSVFINQYHVLDNVLYIPNFTFNLLFVTILIDNISCVIIFIPMVVTLRTKTLKSYWIS